MRVFIQRGADNEFISEPCYVAYHGFSQMGWEVLSYKDEPPKGLSREDVVVGWIGSVRSALKNLGIEPPTEIDYPDELKSYLGRNVWKSTMHKVSFDESLWPVFIKSVKGKMVDGFVCDSTRSLIGRGSQDDFEVWCSDCVTFTSEYRCFVRYGQIVDVRRYKGNWWEIIDRTVVERCIGDYISAPASYCLDFGLTKEGRTLLIEVNDGYAMGSYGLFSLAYAKLISARWHQLVGLPDPCLF